MRNFLIETQKWISLRRNLKIDKNLRTNKNLDEFMKSL